MHWIPMTTRTQGGRKGELGHVDDGSVTFPNETIYATKDRIRIDNKVELSTQRCASVEGVEALVFNKNIQGARLVKCQLVKGSGESTVNEDLLAKHNLQVISPSLNCSVMNNSVGFEVSWQLGVTLGVTLNHQRFEKIVIVVICRDKDYVELRNDILYIIIYNQTAGTSATGGTVPAHKPASNPTASIAGTSGTGSTVPAHKPASNPTASIGTGSTVPAHKPASNPTASTGEAKVKNSIQKTIIIAVSCASFVGLLVLIIIIIVICVIRRREGPSRTFRAKKKPIWSANVVEIAPV